MPATVTDDPLAISCVFSDGSTARFQLDELPCRQLVRDLLTGLVELIHPHGTVNAAGSVLHYEQSIRHLARHLDARGFTGGATDLTRPTMAEYWMSASGPKEACTRRMLQGYQAAGGQVDARLAELAAGRAFNPQRNHHQLPPYPEADWEKLTRTCRSIIDEAFTRHRRALAAAERGRHPRDHGWTAENLRWLLARIGPVGIVAFGEHLGCSHNVVRQRGGVLDASRDLFPCLDTVIAYKLLFGIYSGIVPDGIDDLVADDIDWAGDSTILLSYIKGRTAAESLNLPRNAVRLLEQWLAHSALLRSHAHSATRRQLWLRLNKPGGTEISAKAGGAGRMAIQRWVARHHLIGADGRALKIHRSRIRTTFHSLRDKTSWAGRGRATIDPNHTPAVEGDHYLTATTSAQRRAVEAIVEDAQHDLLRRAHPLTIVTEETATALARDYPRLVAELGLDDTVLAELVGGQRDVFTAACADQLSGLHGPKGKPCPARPWVCLLCPLAVFAPRHAANLLRLKAFFGRQWQQLPAAQFMVVFGPYAHGIDQVLDRFPGGPGPRRRRRRRLRHRSPVAPRGIHTMTATTAATVSDLHSRSPFADADVCAEAGLTLPDTAHRPVFDNDLWDFTDVVGLPVQMSKVSRRFDFTAIADGRWRVVAKEQILAMLAPRHDAVALLPRGYRTPLHLRTAKLRLEELVRFFDWLTERGVTALAAVTDTDCEDYLAHRRYVLDEDGHVVGERQPATRRAAAQVIVDLINHRELFTGDRVAATLRPWGGANPSTVAEMRCGTGQNKTAPLDDTVLRPLLTAATYLVDVISPHALELSRQVADADRKWSIRRGDHAPLARLPITEFTHLLAGYQRRGEPLPLLPDHMIRRRITQGWSPQDPLTPIALGTLARQVGYTQFMRRWLPHLRDRIEATLRVVGAEKPFGRNAVAVDRADNSAQAAWTVPLDREQAVAVVGIARTAAITLLAALSGMRSSELMELEIGCCRPPEHYGTDLVRYRLASRVIKGQQLGGVPDEWVVIEPAYRAAELLERLHENPEPGAPLLGRFAFDVRCTWLRNWVNGPAGQRLGLAPIPDTPVSLRALRRTLAIELAYRPGGMLAAKWHLKHIAVATTEGYVSKPGGAQAELLTEVNKHEADRNLELVWTEFRNYQQGIMPAGPGARELTEFFAHVDGKLGDPAAPKTQASDREILNLLTKRARTLHLGVANYCWFTDPSRALCLKLAGTPTADRPLAGMCDSARCPQATHHQRHRPVWAEHAEQTKTFLGSLGTTRRADRARLQGDYDRALRVIADIDAAATDTASEAQA